ncbi:glycosyl transferase [Eubacteriales bacterium OttesenSCG-928-N13]|nr:glycosyl transferase [Eubacteriales bacterium OttesenSCG-928-N13]
MERLRLRLYEIMCGMARRGWLGWMPSGLFLRLQYFLKLGRVLHLKRPQLYNEKLQWIKLHDHKPEYITYVDKLAVRDYVRAQIGEQHLIPLIASYDSVDEIDWDALPDRFVIKCTHGSSSNIIVTDKSKLNIERAQAKLRAWMKRNWYPQGREWPYLHVKPRIIVEQFIGAEDGTVPFDYKFMCFEGEPTYVIVDADRYTKHTRNFYDPNWVKQDMFNRHPNIPYDVPRPPKLDEMLQIAKALCQGIHHIRIDLYLVGDTIYFGEMTFFHGGGVEVFRPRSFEQHMGDLIQLPTDKGTL